MSGAHVAIKVIDKLLVQRSQLESKVAQEMVLHAELQHPHVLHVEDVFEDARNYYMVLEYCARRSLSAVVKTLPGRRMEEPTAKKVFRQVVAGVAYLHANGVIHRDLKLANLLLNAKGEVKISDFGLAARTSDDHATMCGTPNFIAPEVLASDGEPYDEAVDVWSLGCILYCLLLGKAPFEGRKVSETLENVANAAANPLKFPDGFSASAGDLIKRLLSSEPRNRPSAQQILLHPWLREQSQRRVPPSGRRKSLPRASRQSLPPAASESLRLSHENLKGSRRAAVIRSMKEELSMSSSSSVSLPLRGFMTNGNVLRGSRVDDSQGQKEIRFSSSRHRVVVPGSGSSSGGSSSGSSSWDDASINLTSDYSDLSELSVVNRVDTNRDDTCERDRIIEDEAEEDPVVRLPNGSQPVVSVVMHFEIEDVLCFGLGSIDESDSGVTKVEAQWSCTEPAEVGNPPSFGLKLTNGWEVKYDPASGVLTGTKPDGDLIRYEIPGVNGVRSHAGGSLTSLPASRLGQRAYLPLLVRFCQCLALRAMQLRRMALRDQTSKLPLIHFDKLPESLVATFQYRSQLLAASTSSPSKVEIALGLSNPRHEMTCDEKAVDVPGVGRGCIDATGDLRVVYLDGAQLTLAASGLQLRFQPAWADDDTSEDVFELLTSSSMSAFLPSVVKQKLESIPEFIRRLKAAQ